MAPKSGIAAAADVGRRCQSVVAEGVEAETRRGRKPAHHLRLLCRTRAPGPPRAGPGTRSDRRRRQLPLRQEQKRPPAGPGVSSCNSVAAAGARTRARRGSAPSGRAGRTRPRPSRRRRGSTVVLEWPRRSASSSRSSRSLPSDLGGGGDARTSFTVAPTARWSTMEWTRVAPMWCVSRVSTREFSADRRSAGARPASSAGA